MGVFYQPRQDFVLYQVVDLGKVGRLHMPQQSAQGKACVVIAIGPDVKGLELGDHVLALGTVGQELMLLPDDTSLRLTRQGNIAVVVKETEEV